MSAKGDAATYLNRNGTTWFLHQGTTKSGKPKYFVAKAVGGGAIDRMPEGFEFAESVNGVVSVRRIDSKVGSVTAADVALVERALGTTSGSRYRVEGKRNEIVVHEPEGVAPDELADRAAVLGVSLARLEAAIGPRRYAPVLRFVADGPGQYHVERMTYRGAGGWSYPLDSGALERLAKRYLAVLGTEEFFELM